MPRDESCNCLSPSLPLADVDCGEEMWSQILLKAALQEAPTDPSELTCKRNPTDHARKSVVK